MKYNNLKMTALSLIVISILIFSGCGKKESNEASENKKMNESSTENSGMTKHESGSDHIMVSLPTMQCSTCKKNIETAVKKLEGVESINVVVKEKTAHINYDKSKTDPGKIESAITAAGYDANDKKADPEAYKNLDDCCKLPKDQKDKSNH